MLLHSLALPAHDGALLHINHWSSAQPPKAVVMIAHGMAEHSLRYAPLAQQLCAQGMAVYALDLRGHGQSAEPGRVGHFAERNGWNAVVEDLASLNQLISQAHPHVPIVLLGHSMGSYIAMAYLMRPSPNVVGAILSGSNYQSCALYQAAHLIAQAERWRLGPLGRSRLINFLSFGSFNKAFKPNRTEFDWLSRDTRQVDRYVTDPLCGFVCSTQLWCDLLEGLQRITPIAQLQHIAAELPLLIIGGAHDPVSQGKRLNDLACALTRAGLQQVELKLYPEARHELFNELNRDEVIADLTDWLARLLANSRQPAKEHP